MSAAREAVEFIRSHRRFLVLGHKEPDGDCLASQIACAALAAALGGEAELYSVGPFDRPEIEELAVRFSPVIDDDRLSGAAVIIADCSTPDRTGELGRRIAGLPLLVVDHHSSGEAFGDVRCVDPTAPSTTMIVQTLFEEAGVPLDREIARLLLFGLCTDTGFFRHLGQKSPETFRALARLTETGTSTAEIYMMIYGRRELAVRRLLAEMLSRAESLWNDRMLISWQLYADRVRLGAHQRGEDDLYRLLQTIKGNEVVALIKEEADGGFSVSLRSNSSVDVGAIARSFGGGGHRQAAGFDSKGPLSTIRQTLVDTFTPLLSRDSSM